MKTGKNEVDFFMGANSADGFYTLYGELTPPRRGSRLYLIKGTAGSGKSSMMRRAAEAFSDREELLERLHCSSDPSSLDGVVLHSGRAAILDATPPHPVEPAYPGGFESVVNLCSCLNERLLEERLERIVELQRENNSCHQKCRGLLKCASILLADNAAFVEICTDFCKIDALAGRIAGKGWRRADGPGEERRRLLSAVTNQGVVSYIDTAAVLCGRLTVIRDEWGVASDALLKRLRKRALDGGQLVYTCWCPLTPGKLEHLFLPELGIGFVTQDRFHDFSSLNAERVIHSARFTDQERLRTRKQYLRFNRKAAEELLDGAAERLRQAKALHDELEKQYFDAVDFGEVTSLAEKLLSGLESRYGATT